MDFSSGHPDWAYRPTTMTTDDFKSALTAGLDNQHDGLSQNPPSYRRAFVLTFSWESDPTGLFQASHLRETFENLFHYQVIHRTLPISSATSCVMLESIRHTQTTWSIDESDLLIVYYVGGSISYGQGNDKQVYLEPRWRSPRAVQSHILPCIIDFTRIQRECINQSRGDILLLMDCPFTGGPEPGLGKEIIAASTSDHDSSFSSRLNKNLRRAATDGHVLNSQHLYARLATEAIMSAADGVQPVPIPIHIQHRGQRRNSIFLAPPAVSGPSNWVGVRPGSACFQHVSVVLTVRLRDADRETTGQLRRWLERSPSDGDGRVEIHQPSYFCGGEVVLFKVTLDVWCSLRGYPAINFVSFEQRTRPSSAGPGLAPAPAIAPTGGPVSTGGLPPFAQALWGGNRGAAWR